MPMIDLGQQAFDVAWRTIDGLNVRYATGGKSGEKVVLFSPGFGRSEARADLFAPGSLETGRSCANDCRMHAWTSSRPATASGRSERPSSSRSSGNG
jgi:hypothetical protein